MIQFQRKFLELFRERFSIYSSDKFVDSIDNDRILLTTEIDKETWDQVWYSGRGAGTSNKGIILFNQNGVGIPNGILTSSKYHDRIEMESLWFEITNNTDAAVNYTFFYIFNASGNQYQEILTTVNVGAGGGSAGIIDISEIAFPIDKGRADLNVNENPPVITEVSINIGHNNQNSLIKFAVSGRARKRGLGLRFDKTRSDNSASIN